MLLLNIRTCSLCFIRYYFDSMKILDNPLWILMWRHWRERRVRFAHTIWEFMSGVLFFIVVLLLKHCLHEDMSILAKHIKDTNQFSSVKVLSSPTSGPFRSLMGKVCTNLELTHHNEFYCVFEKNESDIIEFRSSKDLPQPTILVIFQDKNYTRLPQSLNYTIGFKGRKAKTLRYQDLYTNVPHVSSDADRHLDFLGDLQWAIDKTYMGEIAARNFTFGLHYTQSVDTGPAELQVLHNLLIVCSVLAPLPFFFYTTSRLVREKKSGRKELGIMMGVSSSKQRISGILTAAIFGVIYGSIVSILLKIPVGQPVLQHSNIIILTVTLTLHVMTVACLASITSSMSEDSQHSDTVTLVVYLFVFLLNAVWYSARRKSLILTYLVGAVLPHAPMYMFWDEVTYMEQTGHGVSVYNVWYDRIETHIDHKGETQHLKCVSVYIVWTFLLIQLVLFNSLAGYLELVRPGQYGIAAQWNFFLKRKFWSFKRTKRVVHFHVAPKPSDQGMSKRKDMARYFEDAPKHVSIAIKISRVKKRFECGAFRQPVRALKGVSLDVYRGEITVLLGTNGSGKTTLLSIVTGMYSATKGKVYVNGFENMTRLQEVRKDISFCPQNNVAYDFLTVRENIVFYQALKGIRISHARVSAETLMTKLDIFDKADYQTYQLNIGLKRSLQVACALAGDPEVLVLDEPTTGMEDKKRHMLWDLLLLYRGEKTILVASTTMEEAYALGDRIAVINHGRLVCHGSPGFLKKSIGTEDVNLSITFKRKSLNESALLEVIGEAVDDLEINPQRRQDNTITVSVPAKNRDRIQSVFNVLETKKEELGIESVNVGLSMEQVFLRFIEDDKEPDNTADFQADAGEIRITGRKLCCQQLRTLIWRAFVFTWYRKTQFFLLQVLVPVVGLIIVTIGTNSLVQDDLNITTTRSGGNRSGNVQRPQKIVMLSYHTSKFLRGGFLGNKTWFPSAGYEIMSSDNVTRDLKILQHQFDHQPKPVIAFDMKDDEATIYLPSRDQPTLIKSVNLFSNMFRSLHVPRAVSIHANDFLMKFRKKDKSAKNLYLCLGWCMWAPFLIVIVLSPFIMLPLEERHTMVRASHLMAGCPPSVLWYSKLITHLCIYLVIVPPAAMCIARLFDRDKTFNALPFFIALGGLLLGFGPAYLAHLYVLSFFLKKFRAVAQVYIMAMCFCLITPILLFFLGDLAHATENKALKVPVLIIDIISHLSPVFTFAIGLIRITLIARSNAICKANKHLCPDGIDDDIAFLKELCCKSKHTRPYKYFSFSDKHSGIAEAIIFVVQILFYWTILISLQKRRLQYSLSSMLHSNYVGPATFSLDYSVQDEAEYVNKAMKQVKTKVRYKAKPRSLQKVNRPNDILLVENLHKEYGAWKSCGVKKYPAVGGISFSIQGDECFVILGKRGCGKSTILDMLAGLTVITRGDACLGGKFIRHDKATYLGKITWMGEKSGFDGFLSGQHNLSILASLSGLEKGDAKTKATSCLLYMGLESYAQGLARSYSPGCARRLSMCRSLLGAPPVALLDEPLAGVDPHAGPLVARAVKCLLSHGTACVIASEVMEWHQLECITTRLAIMVRGQFVALGTIDQIRTLLGKGFSASIKLKLDEAYWIESEIDDDDDCSLSSLKEPTPMDGVLRLKADFKKEFETSELTDEHLSALYYHIKDDKGLLVYSEIFSKLEQLKAKYPGLIEDYTLNETTIEQALTRLEETLIARPNLDSNVGTLGTLPTSFINVTRERED